MNLRPKDHSLSKWLVLVVSAVGGCGAPPTDVGGPVGSVQQGLTDGTCTLPRNVRYGMGRAQGWVAPGTNRAVLAHTRDFIWADRASQSTEPGVFSSSYLPNDRLYPQTAWTGAWNANAVLVDQGAWSGWAISNEPSWVEYEADKQTPAYEFAYTCGTHPSPCTDANENYYDAPVDISNTAAQQALYCASIAPYSTATPIACPGVTPAATSRFNGISLDNVIAYNDFGRVGTYQNGAWHARYSGELLDPTYSADVADWMRTVTGWSHAGGMCTTANLHYDSIDVKDYLDVAAEVDLVLDEDAFVHDPNAKEGVTSCTPKFEFTNSSTDCPIGTTDADDCAWTVRMDALHTIAESASKGLVFLDKSCEDYAGISLTSLSMTISQYLLVKEDYTYLAIMPLDDDSGFVDYPQLYLPIGVPTGSLEVNSSGAYSRQFDNYLAVVNPASTASVSYELPSGTWFGLDGTKYSGNIELAAQTGLVLTTKQWAAANATLTSLTAGKPFNPEAYAFGFTENTTDAQHEANLYFDGLTQVPWRATLRFTPNGDTNAQVQLLNTADESNGISATFDAANATVVATSNLGAGLNVAATITPYVDAAGVADGSYLCTLTGVPDKSTAQSDTLRLVLKTAHGAATYYQGDGKSGIVVNQVSVEVD